MLLPFKAKWSLLAWKQASCRFIGSDVPYLVERNVVARALSWAEMHGHRLVAFRIFFFFWVVLQLRPPAGT